MKRIFAFALTLLFSWLLVVSAFISSPGETIPACCRKNGQHHCAMPAGSDLKTPGVFAKSNCPYSDSFGGSFSGHFDGFAPQASDSIYAGLLSHPAIVRQVEAAYRVSSIRLRQKRGPPYFQQA